MMKNLESTDLEALLDGATLIDRPPKNDILRSTKNSVDESLKVEGRLPQDGSKWIIEPENLRDFELHYGKSDNLPYTATSSLRAAFSDPWGLFDIGQDRPENYQMMMWKNSEMLWRQIILLIATHLDLKRPLRSVTCWSDGGHGSKDRAGGLMPFSEGIIIYIDGIKHASALMYDEETPLILVSFKKIKQGDKIPVTTQDGLNDDASHLLLYLAQKEIEYGTSVLLRDSQCLEKSYVKKRSELTGFEDTIPSFFRPPESVKSQMRKLKRQREEREDREDRKMQEDARSRIRLDIRDMMKFQRIEDGISSEILNGEVQKDRLQSRRDLKPGRCAWADCLEAGSSHCGRCRKSFYCCAAHQAKDWDIFHRFECIQESGKELLTPSTPSAAPTPVSVVSVNPAPLSATSTTKNPPTEKREKLAVKKINGFDSMTSVHPTSVGPNGVPPQDIWDTSNSPSICLDLKQLCADVPTSQHVEHERFWIRILLPLIGNGSQALVDQELTMKFSIFEKHSAYPLIKECMKTKGYKGLKGYFPARRHGDFLRVYLEEIDRNQKW